MHFGIPTSHGTPQTMAVISAEQTPRSSVSWSLRIPASCPDLLEGGGPHPVNDEGEVDPVS